MNSIIVHSLRKKMDLSVKEYMVLDFVYHTSYLLGKKVSMREMAEEFDFKVSNVNYMVENLIKLGYLQKNKYNKNITTTELTKIFFLKNN